MPTSGAIITYLDQEIVTTDISDRAPYIDHMHLDDQSIGGEEWLIGTAKSYDPDRSGEYLYVFKVKLDPTTHAPIDSGLVLKKISNIAAPGYVVAVRPTLVSGEVHLVYVTDIGDVFYMTWDWSSASSNAVKLYENVEFPVAGTFIGSSFESDQGLQIYEGYLGSAIK